eukprot:COSAG01_NODE_903_length_12848_cov_7.966899_15_plen_96_part_00
MLTACLPACHWRLLGSGWARGPQVYGQISPERYGADMTAMKALLEAAWSQWAPGKPVPKLVGPDNGADDMSASHLDGILSAAGGAEAMVAATYHE